MNGVVSFFALVGSVGLLALTFSLAPTPSASANPGFYQSAPSFSQGTATARASSTLSYMPVGKSTTTLGVVNLTYPDGNTADKLVLDIWYTASSSPLSQLSIEPQYSHNGVDWYTAPNKIGDTATSTQKLTYTQVASTTDPLTGTKSGTSKTNIIIENPDRARYARFYFSTPVGAQPGAVYAEAWIEKEIDN